MNEKLKKVFTNKEFWTALIGCIGLFLSIVLSYFSGLKDGILMDNSIRTELIEKTLDNSKINKKRSIDYEQLEYLPIPNNPSLTDTYFLDLTYFANSIAYENESMIDIYNFYNDNGASSINLFSYNSQSFRGGTNTATYFLRLSKSSVNYILSIICNYSFYDGGSLTGSEIFKYTYNSTTGGKTFAFKSNNIVLFNTFNSSLPSLQLFDFGVGCFELGNIPNGGATQEELDEAYQNGYDKGKSDGKTEGYNEGYQAGLENAFTEEDIYNSYLNGFDKGKSEGRIEGYNEGLQVGKEIGYQNRIDSVEDTEQKINSVWTILENAITSVLNVLSFEILPGIPLYICIGVPILLAVLLWFIKMGQS